MGRCIAVADDNDDNRLLLSRLLTHKGYTVLLASNGLEALELGRRQDVDLLLLDSMMPGLRGPEVLEKLRAEGVTLPIIMLTALDTPEQVAKALELGADDYVTKPFSPVVLLARLERRLRVTIPAPAPAAVPISESLEASASAILESSPADPVPAVPATPGIPATPGTPATPGDRASSDSGAAGGAFASLLGRFRRAPTRSNMPAIRPAIAPGTTLGGRYRVGPILGQGAFGIVYRAHHVDLEADVAIKVLRPGAELLDAKHADVLEAFRREAVRACRVRHENAVRVMDFGTTDDGQPYLVMELLHGESLEARLRSGGPLQPAHAANIMSSILGALAAAHALGVIHQDVKAANIFLHQHAGQEIPKLIDFGAASEVKDKPSNVVVGTPSHMAPERFATGACDAKGDVYSAGITLYQTVTGVLPFPGDDVAQLAKQHTFTPPAPPGLRRPSLPPAWDVVMARLLAKKPGDRPSALDAAALVKSLAG